MSGVLKCLLCDWEIEPPTPQYAPAVAAALGLPTEALASIHQQQNMHRLESDLRQHFSGHKVEEWVKALREAREEIARLEAEVLLS